MYFRLHSLYSLFCINITVRQIYISLKMCVLISYLSQCSFRIISWLADSDLKFNCIYKMKERVRKLIYPKCMPQHFIYNTAHNEYQTHVFMMGNRKENSYQIF